MMWWAMFVVWPVGYLVGGYGDVLGLWAIGIAAAIGFATVIAENWLRA